MLTGLGNMGGLVKDVYDFVKAMISEAIVAVKLDLLCKESKVSAQDSAYISLSLCLVCCSGVH